MKILVFQPVRSAGQYFRKLLELNNFKTNGIDEEYDFNKYNDFCLSGHYYDDYKFNLALENKSYDYLVINIRKPTNILVSYFLKDFDKEDFNNFLKNYNKKLIEIEYYFKLLKDKLNIDIDITNFDKSKGFKVYEGNEKIKKIILVNYETYFIENRRKEFLKELNLKDYNIDKIDNCKNFELYLELLNKVDNQKDYFVNKYFLPNYDTIGLTIGIGEKYINYSKKTSNIFYEKTGLETIIINYLQFSLDLENNFEKIQSVKFFFHYILLSLGINYKRFLYFDCDLRPVRNYNIDLEIPDFSKLYFCQDRGYIEHVQNLEKKYKLKPNTYVNGGFFLCPKNYKDKFLECAKNYDKYEKDLNEQCVFNQALKDDINILPRKFDVMNYNIMQNCAVYNYHDAINYKIYNGEHEDFFWDIIKVYNHKDLDNLKNFIDENNYNIKTDLCEIMNKEGSDKGKKHNYTKVYHHLFKNLKNNKLNILEIGIGTNNITLPSNMGSNGIPGASLRGWKKYFPNSIIFGCDIDRNILKNENRIIKYYLDSLDIISINNFKNNFENNFKFDIIIDDGLHEFKPCKNNFDNLKNMVNKEGYYIIEDIQFNNLKDYENYFIQFKKDFDITILYLPNGCEKNNDNILLIFKKL